MAVIGNFDDNYKLIDPLKADTFYGLKNSITAHIGMNKGLNYIKGIVYDYGDTGEARMITFCKVIDY